MLEGLYYQNGMVCDDIEAGIELFRQRGKIRDKIHIMDVEQTVQTPSGPLAQHQKICFIWINNIQYELIQPIVDTPGIYTAPFNGGPLRFHHICMKVDDWADFRARVDQQDFPVAFEGGGDELKFLYLDARAVFGHYLEYTWMTDVRWEQIKAM
jgi:hypothetical protein